ncbi:Hsp20/alpha crystallin family protein [Arcticibacter eurypsychrophilus]|uniref:Hsp20/alpha crystallin family protein n=1 Tax=Arcticibacter eurypsychrophilus TaxID=1434752 RepID=UPI00084DC8F4|nr:Hsp20/alpha crystallin family protein [Arcticibacter eurypsychrophilus]
MIRSCLKKEGFSVQLDKKILTITVEQKSDQKEQDEFCNKREFSYQSFVRSFSLPESADDAGIEAKYVDRILSIQVAKKDEIRNSVKKFEINKSTLLLNIKYFLKNNWESFFLCDTLMINTLS